MFDWLVSPSLRQVGLLASHSLVSVADVGGDLALVASMLRVLDALFLEHIPPAVETKCALPFSGLSQLVCDVSCGCLCFGCRPNVRTGPGGELSKVGRTGRRASFSKPDDTRPMNTQKQLAGVTDKELVRCFLVPACLCVPF